jgi:XTP/dITP diphosphohydrolase
VGPEIGPGEAAPALLRLVEVMDRLRSDCPWDREQTHTSLTRYLLEETHEVLEAIDTGDRDHLREELGDLLMQVYFHARIAQETPREQGGFDIDDVAAGIADKLVRRHPHVFAGLEVADAEEVERNWEAIKAQEKTRTGPTEGIPASLPALAYADKVVGRLQRAGEVSLPDDGSLGSRLLALVAEARAEGLDPETELRLAVRRLLPGS